MLLGGASGNGIFRAGETKTFVKKSVREARRLAGYWMVALSKHQQLQGQGQACTPLAGPFRAQAQINLPYMNVIQKLNQIVLCTTKFNERLAMLIPKVAIHSSISPWPQALVPAVRLKF